VVRHFYSVSTSWVSSHFSSKKPAAR
jgi:hypothetical protein